MITLSDHYVFAYLQRCFLPQDRKHVEFLQREVSGWYGDFECCFSNVSSLTLYSESLRSHQLETVELGGQELPYISREPISFEGITPSTGPSSAESLLWTP